jgi:hypothetical protein
MSSNVEICNNQGSEANYNILKGNIYKRTIQVDNTGRTAKSDYFISFVIDHLDLWQNDKSAFNFCDLRVYDADGITPLEFEVQSPCTPYCLISVRVGTLAVDSSKNIFIEYGNVALAPLSTNIWGLPLEYDSLVMHLRANEADKTFRGGLDHDDLGQLWQNVKKTGKIMVQNNPSKAPLLKTNVINGLPVFRFDGTSDCFQPSIPEASLHDLTGFSLFFVAKASSLVNYQSIIRFQNAATLNYVVFPFSDGKCISSSDGGIAGGVQLNPTLGAFCLGHANWKKDTATSGFQTYLNGILQNERTSANANTVAERLGVGSYANGGGDFFNGDIAEILIFQDSLNSSQRFFVENYLNTKYRIYGAADMPAIVIGSEQSVSTPYTYTSYAPVASWTSTSSLDGVTLSQKSDSKIQIKSIFQSVIVAGSFYEGWSASSQWVRGAGSSAPINLSVARTRTITTFQPVDTVDIRAIDTNNSSLNISRLDNFCIYNEVEDSYLLYPSTDNDYITLDFAIEDDSNFNLSASYILFSNFSGTTTYRAFLTLNESTIIEGFSNKIAIKKGNFTRTGTGGWADMAYAVFNFQTSSGSAVVHYGNLMLVQDTATVDSYKKGKKIRLSNAISSDSGLSYFNQPFHRVVVKEGLAQSEDISLTAVDLLDIIKDLKMSQINAFTENAITFNTQLELASFAPNHKIKFFTYFVKKLLTLAIPNQLLDIDLDYIEEDESTTINALNYFCINEEDKFGDVLDSLLNACGGVLVYNQIINKYVARNAYKNFDTTNYPLSGIQLSTPYTIPEAYVLDFKTDTRESEYVYNHIETEAIIDQYRYQSTVYSQDAISLELKPNGYTTVFLEPQDTENIQFASNLTVSSWFISPDPTSDILNNDFMSLEYISWAGKSIAVRFNNSAGVTKYLRKIEIRASVIYYLQVENYSSAGGLITRSSFKKEIKDENSISTNGKNSYPLGRRYQYNTFDFTADDGSIVGANWYSAIVNRFATQKNQIELQTKLDPNLRLGLVVQVRDKNGKRITGIIISIDQDSSPPEFTTTCKIIQIV